MEGEIFPPPVIWAQRSELVYLTINLEDIKDPIIKFSETSIYFKGSGGIEKRMYEVAIQLYKEINPEKSKTLNKERCLEIILAKKDTEQPYWPSLTEGNQKYHWLKCDFNKWQDEDESEAEYGPEGSGNMSDVTLDAYDEDEDEKENVEKQDVQGDGPSGPQTLYVEAK